MRKNIQSSSVKLAILAASLAQMVALLLVVNTTKASPFLEVVLVSPVTSNPVTVASGKAFDANFTVTSVGPAGTFKYKIYLGAASLPVDEGTFTSTGLGVRDIFTVTVITPTLINGNYDLRVEVVVDTETPARGSSANEVGAVIVENAPPLWANWFPTNDDALFGTILWKVDAWDPENGIATVDWEYYAGGTWNLACRGALTTPPTLYTCEWDSLILPDKEYQIRIVITNQTVPVALRTITDPVTYQIDNTQVSPLKTGWNLVSVDRIPLDYDIYNIMWNPLFSGSLKRVSTFFWENGILIQKTFIPGVVTELSEIRDGQGYWIDMRNDDIMAFDGRPLPEPPAPSPSYLVHAGWNLIGFKSLTPRNSASYLGPDVVLKMQRPLYGFNRYFKIYTQVNLGQDLQPGEGYWLSLSAPGTIYP